MAKKKAECYSCGSKGYQENFIEEQLDDEGHSIYFCCEHCRSVTSDEEILDEKIYLLFKQTIGAKTLNKNTKSYIRNQLNENFDGNKRRILFSILLEKSDKLRKIMAEKTFPQAISKVKYVIKAVENDVNKEFKRQQDSDKLQTDFEVPIPLVKSVIKRVRDISKYLN